MLIPPEPQPFSALRSARSQLGGDGKEESTPFETPNLLPAPSVVTVVTGRHAELYLWHATSFAHATCCGQCCQHTNTTRQTPVNPCAQPRRRHTPSLSTRRPIQDSMEEQGPATEQATQKAAYTEPQYETPHPGFYERTRTGDGTGNPEGNLHRASVRDAPSRIAACLAPFSLAHGSASPLLLRTPSASHLHRHAHHRCAANAAYLRFTTACLVVVAGIMRIHTLHPHLPQSRVQLTVLCSFSQHLSRTLRWLWHVLGISYVFSYSNCTTSHLERWTHVRMLIPPELQPHTTPAQRAPNWGGTARRRAHLLRRPTYSQPRSRNVPIDFDAWDLHLLDSVKMPANQTSIARGTHTVCISVLSQHCALV